MILVTTHDQTGRIHQQMRLLDAEEADTNVPEGGGWVEGYHDPATKWIDNGEVKDRPTLDVAPPALVAGASWSLTLPVGTEIAVVAEDGVTESTQTTDAEMVEIAFEDAGQWTLRLTPPFPYQPAEIAIEVTDAD